MKEGDYQMSGILLLNADYSPLRVITIKRGVGMVIAGKAEVIEEGDDPLRSAKATLKMPSVIKLTYWVKIPYRSKVPLNRKALIARDHGECQMIYKDPGTGKLVPCTRKGHTIDHVYPKSKGGKHEWKNVTLACATCNSAKANFTLEELGWKLKSRPEIPKVTNYVYIGLTEMDRNWEKWEPYLAAA